MKSRPVLLLAIVAIVALCGYVDYTVVLEYYGAGSPYYGRSINMDKWQNPLPFLALVNAVILAVIGFILNIYRRK